jgi:hypothetical protein
MTSSNSDQYSRPGAHRIQRATFTLIGFVVLGAVIIVALENATGMKVQTGPFAAIVIGLLIAAAGAVWHIQTTRVRAPASPAAAPPPAASQPAARVEPQIVPAPGDHPAAPQVAAPQVATPQGDKTAAAGHAEAGKAAGPAAPAIRLDMPDTEFKSATLAFADKMRTFEQSYDSRRYQIFDQQTETQEERDQQTQDLKALQTEKVSEFSKDILPQAHLLEKELLRRLEQRGISDVPMPPPPAGTSIAMGKRLLQVDVSDVGLLGHRPLHGLAAYLELLASKLTD